MARGNEQAQEASKLGVSGAKGFQEQGRSLYGVLNPALTADITAPTGFTPSEKATMRTAAEQSAGGANAGAVGQGALAAQRTGNAGTADAAIAESARATGREATRAALAPELADAELKQSKMAAGKGMLGNLYGISAGAGNQALGQTAANVDANSRAEEQSWNWAKYMLGPMMKSGAPQAAMKLLACWVAEAIYGVDDQRTHLVRAWLNADFRLTFWGRLIMGLYLRIGRRVATWVRQFPLLGRALKPLFDKALSRALAEL